MTPRGVKRRTIFLHAGQYRAALLTPKQIGRCVPTTVWVLRRVVVTSGEHDNTLVSGRPSGSAGGLKEVQ
jgi:hypothetical protein